MLSKVKRVGGAIQKPVKAERTADASATRAPVAACPGGLLTPAEAAQRMRVTDRVLERWRSNGEGPRYVRLSRKSIRYRIEDLDSFITAGVRAHTAE